MRSAAPRGPAAGELTPLLLSRGIGVEGEDQRVDLAYPVPALALQATDRHHARDACGQERQRITGAFADPQRPGICLQRRRVAISLGARKVIMPLRLRGLRCRPHRTAVQVHQAPVVPENPYLLKSLALTVTILTLEEQLF
jgi:hypothetical protein